MTATTHAYCDEHGIQEPRQATPKVAPEWTQPITTDEKTGTKSCGVCPVCGAVMHVADFHPS